jgi:hypothetical protein
MAHSKKRAVTQNVPQYPTKAIPEVTTDLANSSQIVALSTTIIDP